MCSEYCLTEFKHLLMSLVVYRGVLVGSAYAVVSCTASLVGDRQ